MRSDPDSFISGWIVGAAFIGACIGVIASILWLTIFCAVIVAYSMWAEFV